MLVLAVVGRNLVGKKVSEVFIFINIFRTINNYFFHSNNSKSSLIERFNYLKINSRKMNFI